MPLTSKAEATHQVRITDHTKISAYVSFCLKYLSENPSATLELHTLPNPDARSASNETIEEPKTKKRKLSRATKDIPRLISVVEIVKREFATLVTAGKAGTGNPPGTLLRQYNLINCLEGREEQQDGVLIALEGKNYPKRSTVPYMKVYLTTQLREDLEREGASLQPPAPAPKKSRSARVRERKRVAKQMAAQQSTET